MIRYRLYTERKYNIERIVSKVFDGFTLIDTVGYWQSKKEKSIIIEIIGEVRDYKLIKFLACKIKHINNQQSVYVTQEKVDAKLL